MGEEGWDLKETEYTAELGPRATKRKVVTVGFDWVGRALWLWVPNPGDVRGGDEV